MTEEEIVTGLAKVCGELNAAHARLVDLVAEALRTECWAGVAIHSCEQWVAWHTGLSPARARQVVEIARRQAELPVTCAALHAGELSVDQVAVVAHHSPAAYEADVAAFAKAATVSQLRRTLRTYSFGSDETDPAEQSDRTHVTGWFDGSRCYRLQAVMPLDDGAIVDAALREARDALFQQGDTGVTWCDALVEVARRSLGPSTPMARRDAFVAYLHVPVEPGNAHLHHGPALPQALRRQLLCDARGAIVGVRNGRPVDVGRTRRIVPAHTRRLIEDRDRGCRVPGCGQRHGEIHHIQHWLDGGATDSDNLISLCHRHHRLHHQGQRHPRPRQRPPWGHLHRPPRPPAPGRTTTDTTRRERPRHRRRCVAAPDRRAAPTPLGRLRSNAHTRRPQRLTARGVDLGEQGRSTLAAPQRPLDAFLLAYYSADYTN